MGFPSTAPTKLPRVGEWLLCCTTDGEQLWPGSPIWLRHIVLEAATAFARSCRRTLRRGRHRPLEIVYPNTNEVFRVAEDEMETDDEHHRHETQEPPHIVLPLQASAGCGGDEQDMDFAALVVEKAMFVGLDKRSRQATDYVCCPIARGIDDLDEKDPRCAKLFSDDLLLQECVQHVRQVVKRLISFLGPLDWTAAPCTPRVIAAWNRLLRLDDCFIAPHVPSSVELEKMAEDSSKRIAKRIEKMAVQRGARDDNDALLALNVADDAANAKKDGVVLTIAHGTCDEDVVTCADVNRVLGRVAAHTFLQLHAHHVRALDVRLNGLVHTGGTRNAASSLILRSLRLCTQVRVLRASTSTLAAVYAASLATTVELCELDIRDYLFVRGRDAGMLAAPYASAYASRKVVSSLLLSNATFVERMRQRVDAAIARGMCASLEAMCLYEPRRPEDAIAFAQIAHLCKHGDLYRFEMVGIPNVKVIVEKLLGGRPYPRLAVLRLLLGHVDVTEEHFSVLRDFLAMVPAGWKCWRCDRTAARFTGGTCLSSLATRKPTASWSW